MSYGITSEGGFFNNVAVSGNSKFNGNGVTTSRIRVTNPLLITIRFTKSKKENIITRNWDLSTGVTFDLGDITDAVQVTSSSSSSSSDWCSCSGSCDSKS